ncbi:Alkaline phosphatase [Flagellimonas maritima]|uniref:Alkaline phosphatase n=1 Tax=Flagellimonas maritima TaxID=1383885 RepID=A0A2Z4LNL5_9FLAO|nr:alkaline phosphatase D family protein [Allomuricauda aurantiaca]AWX43329.1 Alkaline phosphatase [Allomuricauda aurantiaca]
MRNVFFLSFIIVSFFACKSKQNIPYPAKPESKESNAVFTIAFGSCNKQNETNPFWDDILHQNPDVWIWGGDNIYADTKDMDELKSMYAQQTENEGYKKLTEAIPVIGTWDDHDYGLNDAGREFSMKKESQQQFLDFMQVPKNSERRNQEGVYASHIYETDKGQIKIFVLDTRYFRSPLEADPDPDRRYKLNTDADDTILGKKQWNWLQEELKSSSADFNLIVTSIQFLSGQHGFESWSNFPKEVEKLNSLITESGAKGVIILSGDRHISEFSKTTLKGMEYPLIDFTSSGLTHFYASYKGEPNKFRVGDVTKVQSFGVIELDLENKKATLKIMGEDNSIFQELKQTY